jgi:hypothetical protein
MRMQSMLALAASVAIAACDASTSPRLAGLNGPGGVSGGTDTTTPLSISPNLVQMTVGTTFQLSTNAASGQQSQLQWSSLNTAIATVSQTGLISAVAPGVTTIVARFAFDTTNAATAGVVVNSPTAPGNMALGSRSP